MKKSELRKEIKKLRSENERISYALQQEQASAEVAGQLLSHAVMLIADHEEDAETLNDVIDSLAAVSNDNAEEAASWHDEHHYLSYQVMHSLEDLLHTVSHHARLHHSRQVLCTDEEEN